MMKVSGSIFRTMLLAGATFAAAGEGFAQTTEPETTPAPDQSQTAQQEEEQDLVITGSRIRRNEFTSTSPIQVITRDAARAEGLSSTAEILQGASAAAGSNQINQLFQGFIVNGGPGAQTISLRGLGDTRTLFLLNGRRVGPSGVTGRVGPFNLNALPDSIVQRFEILKDGASSVYGSDAVAGVVNAITIQNLDEFNITGSANVPVLGERADYDIDVTWGRNFDRGNISVAANYGKADPLRLRDREYLNCTQDYLFNAATGARVDINPATGRGYCLNLWTNSIQLLSDNAAVAGNQTGLVFTPGQTSATVFPAFSFPGYRQIASGNTFALPQEDPRVLERTVFPDTETYSLFVTGSYNLVGNTEIYGEVLANHTENALTQYRQLFPQFSPASPANPFGAFARPIIIVPFDQTVETDYVNVTLGARGEFSNLGFLSGWGWDAYLTWSNSDASNTIDTIPQDRIDALTQVTGTPTALTCPTTTLVTGGNASGQRVPTPAGCPNGFNLLTGALDGNFPANVASYIFATDVNNTLYKRLLANASITGDLFNLPAGPVAFAFGAEYRKDELKDVPGVFARVGNVWGLTTAGVTRGEDAVVEVFGELQVPLLAKLPLIERLQFDGSYRYFNYESYGNDSTYKVGLDWQLTEEYRLRATFGTSYRTPALYELFLANQVGFLAQGSVDPCITTSNAYLNNPTVQANCLADWRAAGRDPAAFTYTAGGTSSARILTGGGIGFLEEETSESLVIGGVWSPNFIDLDISVDYFKIEIEDQIANFGAANILFQCYNEPRFRAGGNFCNLFSRDLTAGSPTNFSVLQVNNNFVNLNTQATEGYDVTIEYNHNFDFGNFRLFSQNTITTKDEIQFFVGTPEDFNGEIGEPDFVGNTSLSFERNDWTFNWFVRYFSKASSTEEFEGDVFPRPLRYSFIDPTLTNVRYKQHTEALVLHSASLSYEADTWSIQGGMSNIFGEEPPAVSTSGGANRLGVSAINATPFDTVLGRAIFVTVSKTF